MEGTALTPSLKKKKETRNQKVFGYLRDSMRTAPMRRNPRVALAHTLSPGRGGPERFLSHLKVKLEKANHQTQTMAMQARSPRRPEAPSLGKLKTKGKARRTTRKPAT